MVSMLNVILDAMTIAPVCGNQSLEVHSMNQ
jgi:hypothetical protein